MISITEWLFLFLIYSFAGWILETVLGTIQQKRFTNRGLVTGPFCVIYGFTAVLMSFVLKELTGFWLFLFSMVLATVIEWTAGHLIERFFGERWWDYSQVKKNLDGYVCLPASLVWGALGFVVVRWGNGLLMSLIRLIPSVLKTILVLAIAGCLIIDMAASAVLLWGKSVHPDKWEKTNNEFEHISRRLRNWITERMQRRIHKAYPKARKVEKQPKNKTVFAYGCSFYKILWIFFIGTFLGDITETIFCRLTDGVWMSRSSVVWGPFSIVWGFAIAAVTDLLYKYKDRSDRFLFLMGTALGGAYEYLCSVLSEMVFGTVFWDYSEIPFNLGGRINLLYCFFWGFAAVAWFKIFYPVISGWIEKLPICAGRILTWVIVVFMCCNMAVSTMALIRSNERSQGIPVTQSWQQTMDERFPDERMEKIYPNAIKVE